MILKIYIYLETVIVSIRVKHGKYVHFKIVEQLLCYWIVAFIFIHQLEIEE